MTVKYNIDQLLLDLAAKRGAQLTKGEVARLAGMSRPVLNEFLDNDRPEIDWIEKWLNFFAAQGMPVTVEQLFKATPQDAGHQAQRARVAELA